MKKIKLTKGKVALVSNEDFDRVNAFKWTASQESKGGAKWYAVRRVTLDGKRVKIRMHRFILDVPPGTLDSRVVHHKDDDGLNNQRENLEIVASNHENMKYSPGWGRVYVKRDEPSL